MLTIPSWQLQKPIHAVIFDCDGTLSSIEGIDELAAQNHVGDIVKAITEEAMTKTGLNPEIYRKRLELVSPNREQVEKLGRSYFEHRVPHAADVIQQLKRLNKSIYLISAGLSLAVIRFGELLNIPRENILAVDVEFDHEGKYKNFDANSPFTRHEGKREVVTELLARHERVAHIGDGMNDFIAHDIATRFIGYGGAYYRENIASQCEYYIKSPSLSALLPLLLTAQETEQLMPDATAIYQLGMTDIHQGKVEFNQPDEKSR